jgi:hypothetical protein
MPDLLAAVREQFAKTEDTATDKRRELLGEYRQLLARRATAEASDGKRVFDLARKLSRTPEAIELDCTVLDHVAELERIAATAEPLLARVQELEHRERECQAALERALKDYEVTVLERDRARTERLAALQMPHEVGCLRLYFAELFGVDRSKIGAPQDYQPTGVIATAMTRLGFPRPFYRDLPDGSSNGH